MIEYAAMTTYKLLPQAQAYGYEVGILLLDEIETHVPGDTAHAATYDFPVLFKVVPGASAYRVTTGDDAVRASVVAAAQELQEMGVKAISSNCGFMLHYQETVAASVSVPVMLSSLLQLPMIACSIGKQRRIAVLTAFTDRLTPDVLALSGLPADARVCVSSIQDSHEFRSLATEDLDTEAFSARLQEAAQALFEEYDDIGAVLLECALYPPYAPLLRRVFNVPVFSFVTLINYLHSAT